MRKASGWEVGGGGVALLLALLACTSIKVEAAVTGFKPDSPTVVLLHVKTAKNSRVSCTGLGLSCESQSVNYAGETDLEIDLGGENADKEKVVHLEVKAGPRTGKLTVDLAKAGLPSKVAVDSAGNVQCVGKRCRGSLQFFPGKLSLETDAGVVAELGSDKLTADESGKIDGAVTVATTPPLKNLPLAKLCAKEAESLGSTTLTLSWSDGSKVSADIALSSDRFIDPLRTAMRIVDTVPLKFSWESDGFAVPKKRRAALYVSYTTCAAAGPADATLADVGIVVTGETEDREDTCRYQLIDKKTNVATGTADGKLTMHDVKAAAYDRLTGKVLGTRKFTAPKVCAEEFHYVSGSIQDQSSWVEDATIAKWANTL